MERKTFRPELPYIFPDGIVEVEDEKHYYETYQGDNNTILAEDEYTLDKAPIDRIIEVTGTVDDQSYTFSAEDDYYLSDDKTKLVWRDDAEDRPDAGTRFAVTYRAESLISRFLDTVELELGLADEKIVDSIEPKFIGYKDDNRDEPYATGEELDRIGKLFGDIGKRRGRKDSQYRIYLETVVESFTSRGTVQDIKDAISLATDVPNEDITVEEDFENNEYRVIVVPQTPVTGSLLEDVAQLADPSGVEFVSTIFTIEPEEIGIDDTITVRQQSEAIVSDQISINDNTSVTINDAETTDSVRVDDTIETPSVRSVGWNTNSWGDLYWTVEHN